jgi:hypothetical protein
VAGSTVLHIMLPVRAPRVLYSSTHIKTLAAQMSCTTGVQRPKSEQQSYTQTTADVQAISCHGKATAITQFSNHASLGLELKPLYDDLIFASCKISTLFVLRTQVFWVVILLLESTNLQGLKPRLKFYPKCQQYKRHTIQTNDGTLHVCTVHTAN